MIAVAKTFDPDIGGFRPPTAFMLGRIDVPFCNTTPATIGGPTDRRSARELLKSRFAQPLLAGGP